MLAKSAAKLNGARLLRERRLLRSTKGMSSVQRYTILERMRKGEVGERERRKGEGGRKGRDG